MARGRGAMLLLFGLCALQTAITCRGEFKELWEVQRIPPVLPELHGCKLPMAYISGTSVGQSSLLARIREQG